MFGNNNDNNDQPQEHAASAPSAPASSPSSADPGSGGLNLPSPSGLGTPASSDDHSALDALASQADPTPPEDNTPPPPAKDDDLLDSDDSNDLLDIKQKALQHLSPLVGHLEQSPEEKFRTMMMMIQASDDQSLLNSAYEAAEKIEDEKERAQALLDIVNEINYFTQQKDD